MHTSLKHAAIAERMIGCATKVHSYFVPGFPEIIYKRSLIVELEKAGLSVCSEFEKEIYHHDVKIGKRRLDLLVEDCILIELKAVNEIETNFIL